MSPPSSRPPSSSSTLQNDRAQIAASNQTVNAFLGGGFRPWMQDAQATPNSIPSPQAVVRSEIRAVRPGRTWSSARKSSNDQPGAYPNMLNNDEPVLPSPALTNEPSPDSSTRQASPNTNSAPVQQQTIYNGAYIEPIAQSSRLATRTSTLPSQSRTEQQNPSSSNASFNHGAGEQSGTFVSQDVRTHRSATNEGGSEGQSSAAGRKRGQEVVERQQAKRICSGQSQMESTSVSTNDLVGLMDSYTHIVKQRIEQYGGYQGLNHGVELPRYKYLKDACEARDGFYVVAHQLFCLWSLDRQSVLTALRPLEPNTIDRGFQVLLQVMRPNNDMRREHQEWFAAFPPLQAGSLGPVYHAHCPSVRYFIEALAALWSDTLTASSQRGYPVTAHDLIARLGCFSGLLRLCLFTVSRRTLGIRDHTSLAADLTTLFAEDQTNQLAAANSPSRETEQTRHQMDMGTKYKNLINAAQQAALTQGPSNSPPAATGQVATSTAPSSQALTINTSSDGSHAASIGAPASQAPLTSHRSQVSPVAHLPHTSPPPHHSPSHRSANVPATQDHHVLPSQGGSASQVPSQPRHWHRTTTQNTYPSPVSASASATTFFPPGTNVTLQSQSNHHQGNQHQTQVLAHPHFVSHAYQQSFSGHWPGVPPHATSSQYQAPHHHQHTHAAPYQAADQSRARQHAPRLQPPAHPGFTTAPRGVPQAAIPNPSGMNHPTAHHYPGNRQSQPTMAAPAQQKRPAMRPFNVIQEHEYPTGPYDWGSHEIAAHLPQLRSPKRKPKQGLSGKFYQYVESLAVQPTRVDPAYGLRTLDFSVPSEQFNAIAQTGLVDESGLPVRYYNDGSYRFRLRCCLLSTAQKKISESKWAVCDTTWPTETYLFLNGRPLGLPRKQHFHRDLPAELSDIVKEGPNVVTISLPSNKCNMKNDMTFFFAVEVIKTASYGRLKALVESTEHMPSDVTKQQIAKRLQSDESGDIIVEDEFLGISLADPFSSVIFQTPVRGIDCLHLECFDLQNWLSTRRCKPGIEKTSEPSAVDCWKCPICGQDARPNSLRIDNYFVDVRTRLISEGKSNVRRIQASPDGTWVPKEEPEDSDDEMGPSSNKSEARAVATPVKAAPVQVIEILDD